MSWCCILRFCGILIMTLCMLCEGCQLQLMETSNDNCDVCVEERYSGEVCSKATGPDHRLYNFSVVSSNAQILSSEFVDNTTLIKINVSREYSQFTGGYLLVFMLNDDSLLCKSVIFPGCRESVASLTLSISGGSTTDPDLEIHQLLNTRAVSEDWISEVTISGSNSSYLKISFDVKSRDVKWYAVELWDSKNNLIKTEKTEKNYIIFMNITTGMYYTVISILEMMKGSQCPCSINVPGLKQCVTCTAKKSNLFTYPTKKEAIAAQESNSDLLVSLICGGLVAAAGILMAVVLIKKKIKRLMYWVRNGSFSTVSLTIVTTIQCPDTVKMLRKMIRTKFNIVPKHLSFSPKDIVQVYNNTSDIVIVLISKYDLTTHSVQCDNLFHRYQKASDGKTLVFAVIEDANYNSTSEASYPTSIPRYLIFNIASNLDFLAEFLAMKIALQMHKHDPELLQGVQEETVLSSSALESGNQTVLSATNKREHDLIYSNIIMPQGHDSVSKVLATREQSRAYPDTYQIVARDRENSRALPDTYQIVGRNQEPEVLDSFSFRSWFIPPDDDSDSAYKTQSECMKTINDAYDVYRREKNTFISSPDIEAISLGEWSV